MGQECWNFMNILNPKRFKIAWLVQKYGLIKWDNMWESQGGSMMNWVPREFPERTQCTPKREDWRSPKGFSKGEPEATSKARPKAKNPRGRRPRRFLAFGLAVDVAKGLSLENSKGGLQYSSEGVHWVLKGPPEGSIHITLRLSHRFSFFLPNIAV